MRARGEKTQSCATLLLREFNKEGWSLFLHCSDALYFLMLLEQFHGEFCINHNHSSLLMNCGFNDGLFKLVGCRVLAVKKTLYTRNTMHVPFGFTFFLYFLLFLQNIKKCLWKKNLPKLADSKHSNGNVVCNVRYISHYYYV